MHTVDVQNKPYTFSESKIYSNLTMALFTDRHRMAIKALEYI